MASPCEGRLRDGLLHATLRHFWDVQVPGVQELKFEPPVLLEQVLALVGRSAGVPMSVQAAKAQLRARGGQGAALASRVGRLSKGRNSCSHPDVRLLGDIEALLGEQGSTDDCDSEPASEVVASNDVKQVGIGVDMLCCDKAAPDLKQISTGVNATACDTEHKQSRYDETAHGQPGEHKNVSVHGIEQQCMGYMGCDAATPAGRTDCDTMAVKRSLTKGTALGESKQQRIDANMPDYNTDTSKVEVKQCCIGVDKTGCDNSNEQHAKAVQCLLEAPWLDDGSLAAALGQLSAAMLRSACSAQRLSTRGGLQALAERLMRARRKPHNAV